MFECSSSNANLKVL